MVACITTMVCYSLLCGSVSLCGLLVRGALPLLKLSRAWTPVLPSTGYSYGSAMVPLPANRLLSVNNNVGKDGTYANTAMTVQVFGFLHRYSNVIYFPVDKAYNWDYTTTASCVNVVLTPPSAAGVPSTAKAIITSVFSAVSSPTDHFVSSFGRDFGHSSCKRLRFVS